MAVGYHITAKNLGFNQNWVASDAVNYIP